MAIEDKVEEVEMPMKEGSKEQVIDDEVANVEVVPPMLIIVYGLHNVKLIDLPVLHHQDQQKSEEAGRDEADPPTGCGMNELIILGIPIVATHEAP